MHTDIPALSGIRTHDPNFRASEVSSCFIPCGHCDPPLEIIYSFNLQEALQLMLLPGSKLRTSNFLKKGRDLEVSLCHLDGIKIKIRGFINYIIHVSCINLLAR
jgi:hypothetical protein